MPSEAQEQRVPLAKTSQTRVSKFYSAYVSEQVYRGSDILAAERESYTGLRTLLFQITVDDVIAANTLLAHSYWQSVAMDAWINREVNRNRIDDTWTKESVIVPVREYVESIVVESEQSPVAQYNRALAQRLCEDHPEISTDADIFNGNPHLKNVRLTVGNILAKLYNYGSIAAVVSIYKQAISEDQVKEAIAYAQDFLEAAIHPNEPSQIDG